MRQFKVYSFNYAHQSCNNWPSFVYSSMMPSVTIRNSVTVAFHELLKRNRRGEGSRLQVRSRELQRNVPVVASGGRDHFQSQRVERF
jgi:hypothetical protein